MSALAAMNVLSLMSGTSLDGVDGVLARLERPETGPLSWQVTARTSAPYPPALRDVLLDAIKPERSDVLLLTQLHTELGLFYAEVAASITAAHPTDLISISGQTVYHIPTRDEARGWRTLSTLQLGEASRVCERCRVPVISDMRQGDMAAGGGGAPLVSFGDLQLYHQPGRAQAVHNLGGISNLTYLPANGNPEQVIAFDTGPANCLLDEAAARYFGLEYDASGQLAAQGVISESVLNALLAHPYFHAAPPKTTGRELFTWQTFETVLAGLEPHDTLATLSALTAESIARAYRDFTPPIDEILVAGGGAKNPTLMRMLRERLAAPVRTFDELGFEAKDREALAFGVMAYFAYHGLPNTLPSATGARRAVVAGKLSRL